MNAAPPDDLAGRQFTPVGQAAAQAEQQQQQASEAQAKDAEMLAALEMGTQIVIVGLLRATRSRIAVNLPEIREEWTDEAIQAPAAAAIPVLRKYAGPLMDLLGQHVELVGLVMACFPLAMGYASALGRHAKAASNTVDVQAQPAAGDGGD